MIFSHISDTHLGFTQYNSEERENDVYLAFDEAIDVSIKDHVSFVIFAGDIFHVPNPSGRAIVVLANALKRLKQNSIDSFFILGEHDISRVRAIPVPYVYHNLDFSRYIGNGKSFIYRNILIAGFDKRRKMECDTFEQDFIKIDAESKNHNGHRILVLHQGISEINKFAGELNATDLPKNFSYYAMGHLHEKELKNFSHLGGPLAYPGSIEITSSEGIKETQKGFYQVDLSEKEVVTNWIKLQTRPQMSISTNFEEVANQISTISEQIKNFSRKPVIEIKITGEVSEDSTIQAQISRLSDLTLRCFWKYVTEEKEKGSIFMNKPMKMEEEMYKITKEILGSEELAHFAINELLPTLQKGDYREATQMAIQNYDKTRRLKNAQNG